MIKSDLKEKFGMSCSEAIKQGIIIPHKSWNYRKQRSFKNGWTLRDNDSLQFDTQSEALNYYFTSKAKEMFIVQEFKYDAHGLMPAIVQDVDTGEVLMLAYVNQESVQKMLEVKKTCFYSRSRKKFWIKGESSGHIQEVKEILTDCDRDTLLIKAKQVGGACHLGYKSCFVHLLDAKGDIVKVTQEKMFDPDDIYPKS